MNLSNSATKFECTNLREQSALSTQYVIHITHIYCTYVVHVVVQ